ncbi:ABC transporter substrate-binding protein [Robinsoniella peoriensis]|uniref:Maltose-binding periplasmic protein n=2 Tax=Robinsoniella TaxID=588605 RepID=A0A4U8Q1H7_9FIRM|nr:ABC transporter substrate-binding protein [Robinsoniella peoriensis]TLC98561.1 Maltose-binding periplasmic protein [Robinsoniella peoriensis]
MRRKNLIALGMAAVMVMGTLAGCSGNSNSEKSSQTDAKAESGSETGGKNDVSEEGDGGGAEKKEDKEVVNLKIHTPVPEQTDGKAVMEALNEYTKEKIGVTVDYVFHGGAYGDKIQTIIASGEEYDACFTSNWLNPYNTNVVKGAFIDITELLPKAAPELQKAIPDYIWTAATVKGGIYAVPNQQIVARQIGALMPKDYVDGTGTDISKVKNLTDLGEYAQKAFDQFGAKVGGVNRAQAADYCGYEYISDYMAAGAIKMDDTSAKVVNFYATDEWKNMLNELVSLNEKGLLDGECGYMDEYGESQRVAKKTSAFYSGTYKPGVEAEESARAGYECVMATAATDPYISTNSVIATMYGISTTSKHPEETLKYLELINTDPYAINLISYGIEGTHYKKTGENTIELISDSGYSHGQSWALGNVFNTYALAGQPEDIWEQTRALNDSAKTSPILGFSFDPEAVKMEVTNVSKVVKEYESLVGGELPVEETNAEFLEKLNVAGIDKVMAEMQKQIDEFLASK